MKGRTIRIYLVDGVPTGILTAEIINWTGKVIVAPRSQLAELAKREESKRTGVYCLIGPDPDSPAKDQVYVGEGDSVLARLTSHDTAESKDFWTKAVFVISKDQNLTKAHGRYLESRLIQMVKQAGRAVLSNGTMPLPPLLPKPQVTGLDDEDTTESPIFVLNVKGAIARAREVGGEFVVLSRSQARKQGLKSWTSYKSLRDQLVADGKLIDGPDHEHYVFSEDVGFSSPSAGGAVVNAGNINGRTAWKVEQTGQTYQEWYDEKLKKAGVDENEG